MAKIDAYVLRLRTLLKELKTVQKMKDDFFSALESVDADYQHKKFGYAAYTKKTAALLGNRSKKGWKEYYNSQLYMLLKQMEYHNSKVFFAVYNDKTPIKAVKKKEIAQAVAHEVAKKIEPAAEIKRAEPVKVAEAKPAEIPAPKHAEISKPIELGAEAKQPFLSFPEKKKPLQPKKQKKSFLQKYEAKKQDETVLLGQPVTFRFFKHFLAGLFARQKKQKSAATSDAMLRIERLEEDALKEEPAVDLTPAILAQEARRVKSVLQSTKKLKIYSPSSVGAIANILVRRFTLEFIESFPSFFKKLYNALRLANIRLLSNTYINIMVLFVIISMVFVFPVFLVIFLLLRQPILLAFGKSFLLGVLFALISFFGFYGYPFMRIRSRRRSINANLPFAINHMSSVTASGVPPDVMFKLIANSDEYGEISIEVGKIVDYIDIFGYDLLTAVKSVAVTTPSPTLKEFFEGLISEVETGGDIKEFLEEKADEAMLSYQLERQKYTETISTYSDIYTGILIAAPLFLVSTLSLVSMLGGTVGGMSVNTLISLSTYIVIPLLNIGFLLFLEMNQPEV